MITVCFTGHRPDKLGGYNWRTSKNKRIMEVLRSKIIEVINCTEPNINNFKFIFGAALGIDQMAFEICYDLKYSTLKFNPCKIELELAIPFEKQPSKWFNKEDIDRFYTHQQQADIITHVDMIEGYEYKGVSEGEYHPAKMQIRNKFMVNNSDIVIAVWNGSKGGTANCVNYAKKQDKEIIVINPDEI